MTEKNKLKTLYVLLAILTLSVFLNFAEKREQRISRSQAPSQETQSTFSNSRESEVLLSVDLLKNPPPPFVAEARNIFQFAERPAVPLADSGTKDALNQPAPPATPEVHYLGFYLEKKNDPARLAAISNGGKIYVGGAGDILAGKYEVLKVEDELLVLRTLSGGKILRLPLGRKASPNEIENLEPPE